MGAVLTVLAAFASLALLAGWAADRWEARWLHRLLSDEPIDRWEARR